MPETHKIILDESEFDFSRFFLNWENSQFKHESDGQLICLFAAKLPNTLIAIFENHLFV